MGVEMLNEEKRGKNNQERVIKMLESGEGQRADQRQAPRGFLRAKLRTTHCVSLLE